MTNGNQQYVSPQGYTLACAQVLPDKASGVWNLTVQMDEQREEKKKCDGERPFENSPRP